MSKAWAILLVVSSFPHHDLSVGQCRANVTKAAASVTLGPLATHPKGQKVSWRN